MIKYRRIFAVEIIKIISMKYTIVGLFPTQKQAPELSENLENIGIKDSEYIVYKTVNNEKEQLTLWDRVFNNRRPEIRTIENDKLITSVEVENEEEMRDVKQVFKQNNVVNIYEFKDMTIEEAKDLDYIKKIVEVRAKAQIFSIPESRKFNSHEGMNSEVKV